MLPFNVKLSQIASVGVNGLGIEPTAKMISDLALLYEKEELLPTIAKEQTPSGIRSRIALVSSDSQYRLLLGVDSFLFTLNAIDYSGSNINETGEFTEKAIPVFTKILQHFDLKANRMGIVTEGVISELAGEQLEGLSEKLFNAPAFFKTLHPFEWDWRLVSLLDREFGGKTEPTNNIVILKRRKIQLQRNGETQPDQLDSILVNLDININPDNTMPRFSYEDVEKYFSTAAKWIDTLSNEMNDFLFADKNKLEQAGE